jgi:hypothetical protein
MGRVAGTVSPPYFREDGSDDPVALFAGFRDETIGDGERGPAWPETRSGLEEPSEEFWM